MQRSNSTLVRELSPSEIELISGGYSSDIEIYCEFPWVDYDWWNFYSADLFDNGYYYDYESGSYVGYGGGPDVTTTVVTDAPPPPAPPATTGGGQGGGTGWDPSAWLEALP